MIHANGHLICAIDTETTGLNYNLHDIIEIAIVPLDYNLEPDDRMPFHVEIAPSKLDNIDYSFIKKSKIDYLLDNAFTQHTALELFVEWFERLNLHGKRIMPLAHNWLFDKTFVEEWTGPHSYNYIFDGRYRDLMSVAMFINDCDDFHRQTYHFPKYKLSYVCSQLGLECDSDLFHTALYDAIKTAEAYKKLCQMTKCLA